MQDLNKTAVIRVAGGVTIEKYDETTKELFKSIRVSLKNTLARIDQLAPVVAGGYAEMADAPVPLNAEL